MAKVSVASVLGETSFSGKCVILLLAYFGSHHSCACKTLQVSKVLEFYVSRKNIMLGLTPISVHLIDWY